MKKYDIFISYRRSSYDTANLIATRLKAAGYSVFFDMETLRSGKFNEQLFGVIENCKDFVLVLPPNALERCVNEDDWIRLEVCHAMANNKNIIPVMLNGFVWSNPMPQGMEELCNYQALTASSIEYFDLAMERLQQRYLVSKRHIPYQRLLKTLGLCVCGLGVIVAILWGIFMLLSRDVCSNYATRLVSYATSVHNIAKENKTLQKEWSAFLSALNYEKRPDYIQSLQDDMMARIDVAEKNIKSSWIVDSVKIEIGAYHSFLLSLHGINAQEIAVSPILATLYYTDFLNQLAFTRKAVSGLGDYDKKCAAVHFEVSEHDFNSYYIDFLSTLSDFPRSSLSVFDELLPVWIYFPKLQYRLGEEKEYYKDAFNTEREYIDELMSQYGNESEQRFSDLIDMSNKLDALEEQINKKNVQLQSDSIRRVSKGTDAEFSKEEFEIKFIQSYKKLKEKSRMEENGDQWSQWAKIRRWGTFLSQEVDASKHGFYLATSITPEVIYADMDTLLSDYQLFYPESKEYVSSAKVFFKDVSKGKRKNAGVIIFAFKDKAEHPFLKIGDIIVSYNGKSISNYDDFKMAYKEYKNGKLDILRIVDGKLEEIQFAQMENTDIIGFLDLGEKL